ncbi:hypothetical protein WN51_13644 [Melipona quadrifasciata]|uniref:Uncharacterized protein n=1 Tax=Melipona quadrifasciata TaxID=166423 RepID=A0A0N1ITN8_9HYME|nr:hypothetical protein WN51_13644 [Melipona quadrifasciata]
MHEPLRIGRHPKESQVSPPTSWPGLHTRDNPQAFIHIPTVQMSTDIISAKQHSFLLSLQSKFFAKQNENNRHCCCVFRILCDNTSAVQHRLKNWKKGILSSIRDYEKQRN